jgi:hypothetical protein
MRPAAFLPRDASSRTWARRAAPSLLASMVSIAASASQAADDAPARPLLRVEGNRAILVRPDGERREVESFEQLSRDFAGLEADLQVIAAGKIPSRVGQQGKSTRIASGEVAVLEILGFIADTTGLPVLYDASSPAFKDRRVVVPAPIERADFELAKRLLETVRLRVVESTTGAGQRVLLIESMDEAGSPAEPREHPVIVVDGRKGASSDRPQPARSPEEAKPGSREGTSKTDAARGRSDGKKRVARGPEPGALRLGGILFRPVPAMLVAQVDLEERRGALVAEVAPEAARGPFGVLERFDIVTHVAETAVTSPEQLGDSIQRLPPASEYELRVLRKGRAMIFTVRRVP